jgi:hypothetical protein
MPELHNLFPDIPPPQVATRQEQRMFNGVRDFVRALGSILVVLEDLR